MLTRRTASLLAGPGLASVVAGCGSAGSLTPASPPGWEPVQTPWCGDEGWQGLDAETCFYTPAATSSPPSVLIFLHGILPAEAVPTQLQSIVREAADSRGFVGLFPRAMQGVCPAWAASDGWCWPTARATVDAHAPAIVEEWDQLLATLEARLETRFARRYLFGFSSGGFFASYLGLEDWWKLDGVGMVGAGRSSPLLSDRIPAELPPAYIARGTSDGDAMRRSADLDRALGALDWPHQLVTHPHRGHELRVDDIEHAWDYWTSLHP